MKYKIGDKVKYCRDLPEDIQEGRITEIRYLNSEDTLYIVEGYSLSSSRGRGDNCYYIIDKVEGSENFCEEKAEGEISLIRKAENVLIRRHLTHGDFKKNFMLISRLWTEYLGYNIEPKDVAVMMILLKTSRIKDGNANEDDWVDIIGYAHLGGSL